MRFLISGGGTGGHLIPGIALYKELSARGWPLRYVLREDDLLFNAASQLPPRCRIIIKLGRVSRSLSFKSFGQVYAIFKAWVSAFKQIKAFNPDGILVTGGYVSNVAALSAFLLRKPLFLLEPNGAAGITNRFWAPRAALVFTFMPEVQKIPPQKIIPTGNPLLFDRIIPQKEAAEFFGFSLDKPILGVSGGSQGSKIINNLIFDLLPQLDHWQILWSLGTREYQRFADEGKLEALNAYGHVKVFRFINRMDYFWSAVQGVLCRAGAGTVAESLFFRKPALFVPIYQSPDNHQYLNAAFLCNQKMSLLLEEPNLNKESLLAALTRLMEEAPALQQAFPKQGEPPAGLIAAHLEEYFASKP